MDKYPFKLEKMLQGLHSYHIHNCANTGPDTICQLDGTLTQQATQQQHYRVLSQIQISPSVDTEWLTHASQFVS